MAEKKDVKKPDKGSNPFAGVIKMKKMMPDEKARGFGAELEKLRKEKMERDKKPRRK